MHNLVKSVDSVDNLISVNTCNNLIGSVTVCNSSDRSDIDSELYTGFPTYALPLKSTKPNSSNPISQSYFNLHATGPKLALARFIYNKWPNDSTMAINALDSIRYSHKLE